MVVALSRSSVPNVTDAQGAGKASEPFLDGAGLEFRYQVEAFMNEEFLVVVGEKTVRLMSSVVLGAETPVNEW